MKNIDPMQLINDILQQSKKTLEFKSKEDPDLENAQYIEKLRKTSVDNFLESIKTRTLADIKKEFEKRIEEYNSATNLYIDRKNKEK